MITLLLFEDNSYEVDNNRRLRNVSLPKKTYLLAQRSLWSLADFSLYLKNIKENDLALETKKIHCGAGNIVEKRETIETGMPFPEMINKVRIGTFLKKYYKQVYWVCGSGIKEQLYFTCVKIYNDPE